MTIYYPIYCPTCREPNGDNIERLRINYFQQWSTPKGGEDLVYRVDFICWACHRFWRIEEKEDKS